MKIALYDTPRAMARAVSKSLSHRGHEVLYEGPFSIQTARKDADVWITKWTFSLKRALLETAHPKRGIVTMSVGTDHIDKAAVADAGLKLENCPTFCTNSVAEHALALAFGGLVRDYPLPHVSEGPLLFTGFSDACAEALVAQMLLRARQMKESAGRARKYDYRRYDSPWENSELAGAKIAIAGHHVPAPHLARMLRLGFNCDMYGYHADEGLEAFGVKPLFAPALLETFDYTIAGARWSAAAGNGKHIAVAALEEPAIRFTGSHVAILGTGRIGSTIARIAKLGFNCEVTAFSTSQKKDMMELGVRYAPNIESAVGAADFIFIALPLTSSSRNIVNAGLLGGLPAGRQRVLVNVTRDGIVDSAALLDALERGIITVYSTDVLPRDKLLWAGGAPEDITRRFAEHPSVVATPHEGDCSRHSLGRLCSELAEKLTFMEG